MRTLLFLLVLVIILVSLGWFREAKAQVQSVEELQRLSSQIGKLNLRKATDAHTHRYSSSVTVDSSVTPRVPATERISKETLRSEGLDTTGRTVENDITSFDDLKPFGLELFRTPDETTPPDDIASSSDYILGPGDNLVINLWGRAEQEYNLTVDREGKVIVPKVGELVAWGKTLTNFRAYAQQKFSKVYSESDLNVSLGKIRSIRIFLTGEVNRPGAYTVSSLTSLFNALYLAGGPTANGTMRDINLMRNGKSVVSLDLYKFLLQGDNTSDVRLESGDAIFVPVPRARVAIRGKVRRPAIYELTGNENARHLLTLAGNALPDAYLERVMLERVSRQKEWEVIDLNLGESDSDPSSNVILRDGDRLTVFSIFEARTNLVAIAGKVKHPGYYERNDSTRISALLAQGQLQDYDVYYGRADLFRRYRDNRVAVIPIDLKAVMSRQPRADIILTNRDSLHIYSLQDVDRSRFVHVSGEVKKPGEYPLYDGMTVGDLVFLAGSFTRGASRLQGELARFDSVGAVSLRYIDLQDSMALALPVQEDDRLYLRQIPEWQLHRTVKIEGEVLYPGEYVLANREETVYQLLQRAGGFTASAFPTGILFDRKSIARRLEQAQIPKMLKNSTPVILDSNGVVEDQQTVTYDSVAVNRLIIDMRAITASRGKTGDIILEPGDRIFIPAAPSGISVLGEVGATGTIKFEPNQNVRYYIERAGNFTPRSDKGHVRLINASGEVHAGGVLGRKVSMGDVIVVPLRVQKDQSWLKTAATAFTATTGALTTVFLIRKL